MAVKPDSDRLYNYNLKFDPEAVRRQTEQRLGRMRDKQAAMQAELVALEVQAKEVLGALGAPTYSYCAYLNFVRESWKKKGRFNGATLNNEVAILLMKWKLRGLEEETLVALRDRVLSIPAP
jgi:hypothetical protein